METTILEENTSHIIPKLKQTINIKLITSKFNFKNIELNLNGFIFNFSNKYYIISTHHNLPISEVINNNTILDIIINSCWSEVLIMNTSNINISEYSIYKSYYNKILKNKELINIKFNNDRLINYRLEILEYEFQPFDNIQTDYLMPYIVAKFITNIDIDNIIGLSGAPVFYNDKLIGMFSKYNINKKCAYILPIYIIIKNLMKKDNYNTYTINNYKNITKINKFNVKKNYIYYPILKINIPFETYLLLEGDINKEIQIFYKDINKVEHFIINKLYIDTNQYINTKLIDNNICYKITSRLLELILKLDKKILLLIFSNIQKNNFKYFNINNNIINIIE